MYFLSNVFLRTLSISKKIERNKVHNEALKKLPNYLMIAAVEGSVFDKIESVKRWTRIQLGSDEFRVYLADHSPDSLREDYPNLIKVTKEGLQPSV